MSVLGGRAALRRRFGELVPARDGRAADGAPLDLRVNPLKSTREVMLRALRGLGLQAEASRMAPYGIRVNERPSLASLPMLKNGEVEIQDEGSQLVAMLVDARPGERVVDFCAGAGGKTLAIAAQMANKGHVIACDVPEGRLKRSAERFRRAGLHNIETRLLASETDRWVKRHKGGFDRVLVDAPCSGTGTWRRNPDARWRALGRRARQSAAAAGRDSCERRAAGEARWTARLCHMLDAARGERGAGGGLPRGASRLPCRAAARGRAAADGFGASRLSVADARAPRYRRLFCRRHAARRHAVVRVIVGAAILRRR